MTKVSVGLGYPIVDSAWRNASTATLRLCLDERAKVSKRHGHRGHSLFVAAGDRPVRRVGLEQTLDQGGRTAPRSLIKVKGVDWVDSPPWRRQAEGFADEVATAPDNPCHHEGARREVRA